MILRLFFSQILIFHNIINFIYSEIIRSFSYLKNKYKKNIL